MIRGELFPDMYSYPIPACGVPLRLLLSVVMVVSGYPVWRWLTDIMVSDGLPQFAKDEKAVYLGRFASFHSFYCIIFTINCIKFTQKITLSPGLQIHSGKPCNVFCLISTYLALQVCACLLIFNCYDDIYTKVCVTES